MENNELQYLLGQTNQPFETDDENYPEEEMINNSLNGYWIASILNSIGKSNFKFIFQALQNKLLNNLTIIEKANLLILLVEKFKEIYDFDLNYYLMNESDNSENKLDLVLEFLSFYSYNHIDFLFDIWMFSFFETEELKVNLFFEFLLIKKKMNLIEKIRSKADNYFYNSLIKGFLNDYDNKNLFDWFSKITIDNKIEIITKIKLMEQKKGN
jgi:hypothetical protein